MEGFPWDRVKAAQDYLYAIKPWWRRFGSRLKMVPVDVPPPPGFPFGATTYTDQMMNLYIDRNFAVSGSIAQIAGAIEHDLQYQMRDAWNKMTWASGAKEKYRKICIDLEINSSINEEAVNLKMDMVRMICSRSEVFDIQRLEKWMVDAPPSILEHSWLPEKLGLPDGLSAEQYYVLIDKPEEDDEDEEPEEEESGGSGEPDPENDEGQGEQQEQPSNDSQDSAGSDKQEDAQGEPQDSQEGDQDDSASNDSPKPDLGAQNRSEDSTPSEDTDGQSQGQPSSVTPAERADEMKSEDPVLSWYASEHDELQQSEDANDAEPSEFDISEASKELAEDLQEGAMMRSYQWGVAPGNSMAQWSTMKLKKMGIHWTSILQRKLSSCVSSTRIQGASDLSYSVPNPNQPQFGAILMGLHDYAPKVYVVADVSASMAAFIETAMSAFKDIVQSVMSSYGESVTWITIDTKVQDVGKAVTMDTKTMDRWRKGFGGTILGYLLDELTDGKFKWKGIRHQRPDVILILSDGMFQWPHRWKKRSRELSQPKVIFCSVTQFEDFAGRPILPDWINPKNGNFIYASLD